jgi:hypothetical protein
MTVSGQVGGRQEVCDNWLGATGSRQLAYGSLLKTAGADTTGGRHWACDISSAAVVFQ